MSETGPICPTSDEESKRSLATSEGSVILNPEVLRKEKRLKRQKRALENATLSKRLKTDMPRHLEPPSESSALPARLVADAHNDLQARRKHDRASVDPQQPAVPISYEHHAWPGLPQSPLIRPYSAFPIRRQPLRIRSTSNAFYQQPTFSPYSVPSVMFGDPYTASPMLMNQGIPYLGGLPNTLESMGIFSMGNSSYNPFGEVPFSPFFPPLDSSLPPQPASPFTRPNQPSGVSFEDNRSTAPAEGEPNREMAYQNSGSSQRVCYLYPSRPQDNEASPPPNSTMLSSVYCYPSPSSLFLSHPSMRPTQDGTTTSGVPFLPPAAFSPVWSPMVPQHANQPGAIRPVLNQPINR